jgi:putative membrane protein
MNNDIFKLEELGITDKLAVQRTIHAERSTLLAWVRTSLSLIGFGFTIFKVLQYALKESTTVLMRPQTPRNIGLFLIITGTAPLLFAIIQYVRGIRRLGYKDPILLDPNFLAAGAIFLLGAVLTLTIVLRISFL